MSALLLVTAEDCHLCDHAKAVLDQLAVPWREIDADSADGERLAHSAPPLRPLLFTDQERLVGYGRLSLKRLRKQLPAAATT